MTPGFMVYWMEDTGSHLGMSRPQFLFFEPHEMTLALDFMKELREQPGNEFVGFVSQDANSVGKPGVDTVANGKTPDGHTYDWKKRRP